MRKRVETGKVFRVAKFSLIMVATVLGVQVLPGAHATGSFTLSAVPNGFVFFTGDPCDTSTLNVTSVGGFSGTVALTYIRPVPSGGTGVSGPSSIIVPAGGSNTVDLNVCPGGTSGGFVWTVNGAGGGFSANTTIRIHETICSRPPCPV